MSTQAFVNFGRHGKCLGTIPYPFYGPNQVIEVYDIGEEKTYGCYYPDGARMANPKQWFDKLTPPKQEQGDKPKLKLRLRRATEAPKPKLKLRRRP